MPQDLFRYVLTCLSFPYDRYMWTQAGEVQALVERIISCKDCIRQVLADKKLTNAEDVQRAHAFIYILHVFDAEVFCAQKEWSSLLRTIEVSRTWYMTLY